jgi:hypothetical protein
MDRIKILDDALWQTVPPDVIKEAEQSARAEPSWIVRQSNGHIVVVEDGPGSPDTATGDISYIAEVITYFIKSKIVACPTTSFRPTSPPAANSGVAAGVSQVHSFPVGLSQTRSPHISVISVPLSLNLPLE